MTQHAPVKCLSLGELANRFGLELRGDGSHPICGVGTLAGAGKEEITFLANRGYLKQLPGTRAGAVILQARNAEDCPVACLISDNPYLAYARIAAEFDSRPRARPGIHPTAVIDPEARIGQDVHIGAAAVIGAHSVVGDGCAIGPGCVVGPQASLGRACQLAANVTVLDNVRIGDRVIIHAGAVIGADGFGIASDGEHWEKVPQLGGVLIGDDCEIGANTAIDRGAIEDTILEEDVRIDNLVQVGHNTFIGAHTAIAGCTAIAGSARIGRHCLVGGNCGITGHIEIADHVTLSARSLVMKSITEPGGVWGSGIPARPLREWQRTLARLKRLELPGRRADSSKPRHGKDHE
jgi:UDP-3-O-[3-hydroxymyristoyl] glucosamine N-acyltransferase